MNPFLVFWLFLKASLFSTGGMGNLPSLHADLLARRWATERQFASAIMIGQASPGPNGLWTVCLGYIIDGLTGAILALVAITIPPLLVLLVHRLYVRVQERPAAEGFMRGLTLSVAGMSMVILAGLMRATDSAPRSVVIAGAAAGLAVTRRVPIVVILGAAALAGILLR